MAWVLNDNEFGAVSALPSVRRYDYFINRGADWAEIWSLGDEKGWVLSGDDQGGKYMLVWPHTRFVQACATGSWADAEPRLIPVSEWL